MLIGYKTMVEINVEVQLVGTVLQLVQTQCWNPGERPESGLESHAARTIRQIFKQ